MLTKYLKDSLTVGDAAVIFPLQYDLLWGFTILN